MSILFSDTTPEMERLYISLLRRATPAQKMDMLAGLNHSAREVASCGIRKRHPEATEKQVRWYLCSLLYGEEVTRKVLGNFKDA
jgi:hypothetical protein